MPLRKPRRPDGFGIRIARTPPFAEALALREAGRLEEAIAAYRRVEPGSLDYFKSLNNLGVLLENTGRPAEAVAVYRRALAMDPNNAGLYYNLAHAIQAAGDLEAAVLGYQKALALEPASDCGALQSGLHLIFFGTIGRSGGGIRAGCRV